MNIKKATITRVCKKLDNEQPVYQPIGTDGILCMEKLLPYICVYRFKKPDLYFSGLLKTQACYLIVDAEIDISELLKKLSKTLSKKFNAFLILEMWPLRSEHSNSFEIFCPSGKAPATVSALNEGFDGLKDIYPEISTTITETDQRYPPQMDEIMNVDESKESGALIIGLAVPTIYERREEQEVYSIFYRKFHSRLSEIIKRTAYEFVRVQTSNPFDNYLMLGKTRLSDITKQIDNKLARISENMSFLLRVTPVNSTSEWRKFKKNNFKKPPSFNYRLVALDPEIEKRKLFDFKIDEVDDPTIAFILRDKRKEIEKQLTMLEERGTDSFRHIGESIYGKREPYVYKVANEILRKYPKAVERSESEKIDCHEFAEYAKSEMEYYQEHFPKQKLSVEIRKDVAGLMVSKSKLLLSDQIAIDKKRVDALVQHEVATHILTYCNGRNQPLKQMYAGFAGYDHLQEGLAVFSEYLVDGLTVNRLRLLAARIVAVESMVNGNSFVSTFELLCDEYGFTEKTAYYLTMRVFRGGGLTKDAVYLSGLVSVIDYIKSGGDINILYTGKFNLNHVDMIRELLERGILNNPVLPRFLDRPEVKVRLNNIKDGLGVTDLLSEKTLVK